MAPLEPKPSDPFIPCCLSCSCSQNIYLQSFELHGQIHRINSALKVVSTRLALSQPSKLGLVIEVVHFHGVLGIQMLESGTSMSLRVRRSNVWSTSLQSRSLEQIKVAGCSSVMTDYDEHSKAILWPSRSRIGNLNSKVGPGLGRAPTRSTQPRGVHEDFTTFELASAPGNR